MSLPLLLITFPEKSIHFFTQINEVLLDVIETSMYMEMEM